MQITLQEVFLIVLSEVEKRDGVPEGLSRLGRPSPGWHVDDYARTESIYRFGGPPRGVLPSYWEEIAATGPAFSRRRPETYGFNKNGEPEWMAIARPSVPSVPDCADLIALEADDRDASDQMSAHERRICRAHRWLKNAFMMGDISTRGVVRIIRLDGGKDLSYEDESLEPHDWSEGLIDYRSGSLELDGVDREIGYPGGMVLGQIHFHNVRVDFEKLKARLIVNPPDGAGVEFPIIYDRVLEKWELMWSNVRHDLSDAEEFAQRKLGLISYNMANLNRGKKISVVLLSCSVLKAKPISPEKRELEERAYAVSLEFLRGADVDLSNKNINKVVKGSTTDSSVYDPHNTRVKKAREIAIEYVRGFACDRYGEEIAREIVARLTIGFTQKDGFCWIEV